MFAYFFDIETFEVGEERVLRDMLIHYTYESEVAGIFHNAQIIISLRRILKALNHPQPPTPLKTDNSIANGFVHKNIQQKRSKSWDMRFYWLRDKILQKKIQ